MTSPSPALLPSGRPGPTAEQVEQARECLQAYHCATAELAAKLAPDLAARWLERAYLYKQTPLVLTAEQTAARLWPGTAEFAAASTELDAAT